jgi:FKBP-type peptidyl-prolyl cis-trans isomerase FkpA
MIRTGILFGLLVLLLVSCKKDTTSQAEIDEAIIQQYIKDNNLEATRHYSGLYYIINKIGIGDSPNTNSYVKVNYTGYLTDGTVFDSGTINYASLYYMITGWKIGVPMLKRGGSAKLIVPSGFGYGSQDKYDSDGVVEIPANSVLIFDLTLIDFK